MPNVVDYYSESNYKFNLALQWGDRVQRGQSFTGNGNQLYSAKFFLSNHGTISGNMYALFYAHTGTYGTSSLPLGNSLLTSSPIAVSSLTTTPTLVEFIFTPYTLVDGTHYVIVIYYPGGDATHYINVGCDNSGATHGGNACYTLNGTNWSVESAGVDIIFYVYGISTFVPQIIVS